MTRHGAFHAFFYVRFVRMYRYGRAFHFYYRGLYMKTVVTAMCVVTLFCFAGEKLLAQNPLPPLNNLIVLNPNLPIPLSRQEREIKELLNDANTSEKNPALSFICSVFMPGLGQFYNEQVKTGLLVMGTQILCVAGAAITNKTGGQVVFVVLYAVSELYSIIQAPLASAEINQTKRDALYELKVRGISLTSITPYYSPTNGTGLSLALSF